MRLRNFLKQIPILNRLIYLWELVHDMNRRLAYLDTIRELFFLSLDRKYQERALELLYFNRTGKRMDISHPRTFNEKLQWLKIYEPNQLRTQLCDKYKVRDWVEKTIGAEYLIPLLGVWNRYEEIDTRNLPDQFILKFNHTSGTNLLVTDKNKFDKEKYRDYFLTWLKQDYSSMTLELMYRGIEPKIIAEENINPGGEDLLDYKFICCNGKPLYVWIDSGRYTSHHRNIYDMDWNPQPFEIKYPRRKQEFPPPENFEKMKMLATKLCSGFYHVRVDLYNLNGKIYFGEMTFASGGGCESFYPDQYDRLLGDMLHIPPDEEKGKAL